jgi:hypothetical protein
MDRKATLYHECDNSSRPVPPIVKQAMTNHESIGAGDPIRFLTVDDQEMLRPARAPGGRSATCALTWPWSS